MRIALDTNILLSVIVFKSRKLAAMLDWICQNHTLILSTYVLDECREVVQRKNAALIPALDRFLESLPYEIVYTPQTLPDHGLFTIRDPDDEKWYILRFRRARICLYPATRIYWQWSLKNRRYLQQPSFVSDSISISSRLYPRPHLVDKPSARFHFVLLPPRIPRPNAQEPRHIHSVDLVHAPAAVQQAVVGRVYEVRQRQAGVVAGSVASACAAFVGNSSSMPVVCVCTAISASAMSCISRSTG